MTDPIGLTLAPGAGDVGPQAEACGQKATDAVGAAESAGPRAHCRNQWPSPQYWWLAARP